MGTFRTIGTATLLGLAACGRQAEPAHPSAVAESPTASAVLADTRLAALYERACAACHEVTGTGAPLHGDRKAWAPREVAGVPALVASVRQGKGAMPPMGWCPECSDEDLTRLIAHLREVSP
ncbi:MAG TPA: c-type cytochrome [Ideonella sp.]|uniref:c-type cytochrome n=1 Tax=Ideonella sp. TaxID=1929293 RepID=UPI002E381B5A|nr:c-type cytochrome [Ideonella sp.]HEX5686115.1 c-type cytochrome [Ideonella sp.]